MGKAPSAGPNLAGAMRRDSGQAAYLALWNTHCSLPPQQD
jgi:hypothetical protein